VLLCVPTQQLGRFLDLHREALSKKALLACCKGIDLSTLKGTAEVIANHIPSAIAGVLTGPSFAADIARGLPTALTLATQDDADAAKLQQVLTRPSLRIYRTTDVTGAQLGGALKNVIAIAAGVCIGAGLGESARAALITRGFAEVQKLASVLGAQPETLMGLSGLGDLILTCSSEQSRNYSYGLSIGRAVDFDPSVTVEGASTAQAVTRLVHEHGLDLPVSRAVDDLVSGRTNVEAALHVLLSRPLKQE
jgi:glycerol-3-phosphate dehydrogenase (NAD(P)+)